MIKVSLVRNFVRVMSKSILINRTPLFVQRSSLDLVGGRFPLPNGVSIKKSSLANRSAWWFEPKQAIDGKVVLYIHGGAYCIGSPRSHRDLCSHLAIYSNRSVVAVDYRLAPEHPFPAAINDVIASYEDLLSQNYKPSDIVLAGDSAGGGLCASALQIFRDSDIPMPAASFLISPWLDMKNQSQSHRTKASADPLLSTAWLDKAGQHYMGGENKDQPKCSPLSGSVHGFPPTLIHVGSEEILLDDSLSFNVKAQKANVRTQLKTWPKLWHVFHFTPSALREARTALKEAGDFIRAHS